MQLLLIQILHDLPHILRLFAGRDEQRVIRFHDDQIIHSDGGNTICPGCKQVVITRSWHAVMANRLKDGCCANCGTRIAGVFTKTEAGKRREWANALP